MSLKVASLCRTRVLAAHGRRDPPSRCGRLLPAYSCIKLTGAPGSTLQLRHYTFLSCCSYCNLGPLTALKATESGQGTTPSTHARTHLTGMVSDADRSARAAAGSFRIRYGAGPGAHGECLRRACPQHLRRLSSDSSPIAQVSGPPKSPALPSLQPA